MKFQNPSFKFFLNGRTNKRTDKRTDKPKAICSPLFQSWGHNNPKTKHCTVVQDREEAHCHQADSTIGDKV